MAAAQPAPERQPGPGPALAPPAENGQDAAPGEADAAVTAAGASEADAAVTAAAQAAADSSRDLRLAPAKALDGALTAMADRLAARAEHVVAANEQDMAAARAAGAPGAMLDRLLLDPGRLAAMAGQLHALARVPAEEPSTVVRELPGGLVLAQRRLPVGVIGANFEARPNVVADIASQFVKSRNAGVLRTGSAALRSAAVLIDLVIGPALAAAGISPQAIQLVRVAGRESARALVARPRLIPLVILRGSGASTAELAAEAARHGVRTLAHADGGAVIYLDESADPQLAASLIESSLDRLGVCNRLNLLLVHVSRWEAEMPRLTELAARLRIALSLPPHAHPLGHEWALDAGHEATITVAPATDPAAAAQIASTETSGLAACIVAQDAAAAGQFLDTYTGTGAFWNATPRLLDGFRLLTLPETGINIDRVPGPRGPVTFRDLYLRQYVVQPGG